MRAHVKSCEDVLSEPLPSKLKEFQFPDILYIVNEWFLCADISVNVPVWMDFWFWITVFRGEIRDLVQNESGPSPLDQDVCLARAALQFS